MLDVLRTLGATKIEASLAEACLQQMVVCSAAIFDADSGI